MDPDIFTATGFSRAVAAVVEKRLDSWFVERQKEQATIPGFETVGPVIPSRVCQPIIVPTAG
jgi:hypothetical protein